MKRLTTALQSWSQKHILHHLEMAQDHRDQSADEDWLRRKLKQHCLTLVSIKQMIARLRSRVRHLKDEDANTAFFHKKAGYRKRKNFISKLVVEDQVVTPQ